MALKRKRSTRRLDRVVALVSTTRQEIVDTLEAMGGEASASDLAKQLGRSADGLYYHLGQLVEAQFLCEVANRNGERGRRYRTNTRAGTRIALKYGRGVVTDIDAMSDLAGSLLRTVERDFLRALRSGHGIGSGAQRNLWISRVKGWVGARELTEINRLLVRLSELLHQPRSARRNQLISLAWGLAPMEDRPLRR